MAHSNLLDLIEDLVDAAEKKGFSPEQCGAWLNDAVQRIPPPGFYPLEFRQKLGQEKNTARSKIIEILGVEDGRELLRLEEKFMNS